MKKFKEAKKATEEMFEEDLKKENSTQKVEKEKTPPPEAQPEKVVEKPQAEDIDPKFQQALAELKMLSEENRNLRSIIEELSRKQEEKIIKETVEKPSLDINSLAFADQAGQKKIQEDYSDKMTEYVKSKIMKELSPFIDQAKQGIAEKEKQEVIDVLSQVPELEGIKEMLPQIERIINNNTALSGNNLPLDEKYITAYAIAKGVNAMNQPQKELTAEELFEIYQKNGELQDMIEKKKLKDLEAASSVPPHSASGGAVNAALNIKDKPKTFEEASELTKKMFGI